MTSIKKNKFYNFVIQKLILKDEFLEYREEEDTIDYILFIIHELTGKLYKNQIKIGYYCLTNVRPTIIPYQSKGPNNYSTKYSISY